MIKAIAWITSTTLILAGIGLYLAWRVDSEEECPECEHPLPEDATKCWNCESWGGGREIG